MIADEDYSFILSVLLDNCNKKFHKTTEAEYLKQKREKMDEDCKNLLAPDDIPLVEDFLCIISEIEGAKTEHAYVQGLRDCVSILKRLNVL